MRAMQSMLRSPYTIVQFVGTARSARRTRWKESRAGARRGRASIARHATNQLLLLALASLAMQRGCAGGARCSADKRLPVRNVVLYRSGVGYFERSGSFDGRRRCEFRVKQRRSATSCPR